jgi:hypothetical protein
MLFAAETESADSIASVICFTRMCMLLCVVSYLQRPMAPNRMQLCQAFESAMPAVGVNATAGITAGAVKQAEHAVQQLGAQARSGSSSSSSARAVTR